MNILRLFAVVALGTALLAAGTACKKDKDDPIPVDLSASLPEPGVVEITVSGQTFSYRWDGTLLTPVVPFEWEKVPDGSVEFHAKFTPDAAGTPEKDIRTASLTVEHGKPIRFTDFTPIHARITVTLIPGEGYTQSELNAATVSFHGISDPSCSFTGRVCAGIFKPKTSLTDDHKIGVCVGSDDRSFLMTDFSFEGVAWGALEANQLYEVEIELSRTASTTLQLIVKPWKKVNGTGEFE